MGFLETETPYFKKNIMIKWFWLVSFFILTLSSCADNSEKPPKPPLQLSELRIGTVVLNLTDPTQNSAAPINQPIEGEFSAPLDKA